MLKKLAISLLCSALLLGEGAIVFDPTNAANTGSMLANLVEAIKKYEEMIQKANEQIGKLNQIV